MTPCLVCEATHADSTFGILRVIAWSLLFLSSRQAFPTEAQQMNIRLLRAGFLLQGDHETLHALGVGDNCVLLAQVSALPPPPDPQAETSVNIGMSLPYLLLFVEAVGVGVIVAPIVLRAGKFGAVNYFPSIPMGTWTVDDGLDVSASFPAIYVTGSDGADGLDRHSTAQFLRIIITWYAIRITRVPGKWYFLVASENRNSFWQCMDLESLQPWISQFI